MFAKAMIKLIFSFYLCLYIHFGLQICDEEFTHTGIRVQWRKTVPANNVKSDPPCYYNNQLITRNCVGDIWDPPASELSPCLQLVNYYNLSACPPGFYKISKSNHAYCYQIKKPSAWDYPCLKSGGASVITDLSNDDVISLLNSLKSNNSSQFFWLPAKRTQFFSPIVWWHIPGPKWGHPVESNNLLSFHTSKLKNCLLLDTQQQLLITESCSERHPSLCFYINDIQYPAKCPPKYHAIRYMPDEGMCLGIEEPRSNLTFNSFIDHKICNLSMGNNDDLRRFVFKKIAAMNNLSQEKWCWFYSFDLRKKQHTFSVNFTLPEIYISINKEGTLGIQFSNTSLPCMACLTKMFYKKTDLLCEYNEKKKVLYLTVYHPSGLWKYSKNDRGIQCFSNLKGFARVVKINDMPIVEVIPDQYNLTTDIDNIDKIVYKIDIITDRAAQYWCEGHTANFSFIKSNVIMVNPQGDDVHVLSLIINIYFHLDDIENNGETITSELCSNLTHIFDAEKVILMEYLNYSSNYLMLLLHMHIAVDNLFEDNAENIQRMYNITLHTALTELPKYNYALLSLASSMYCLPTTSIDNSVILNWELTPIGHIAAPKQFCLQENGLPVKRLCNGTYLSGSFWGPVEGTCNYNYQPSDTTTFLYKIVKGQVPESYISRFLTDGLGFVLRDVDIIIPADIYYLSMSLQHILSIAQDNETLIDMGNIENIAWVMDRVMVLNDNYLRLAQTLNSTNVILDSLNNIIEILAHKDETLYNYALTGRNFNYYQLAIQPQFILQISYPSMNNISGLAVIKSFPDDDFSHVEIRPLFKNTTLKEVLSIENLEIATWLPDTVLNSVEKNKNVTKDEINMDESNMLIIISVFHNDAIFQELETNIGYCVNSRIIGISLPGFLTNFMQPIPLVYRDLNTTSSEKFCGFWNFQPHSVGNIPGYWSNSGCYLKKSENGFTICECDHLTHFGQLLNIGRHKNRTVSVVDRHTKSLNIISLVGSFLSLSGIVGIWITASVFHTWRKKASTKVLLHLSTSIALPLIFMVVFNLDNTLFKKVNGIVVVSKDLKAVCISLGALLHYSVLASFMWMLIAAVLQFVRYVRVLGVYRPSRFMIKFTLVGWGIPVIPVIVVLALDRENYIPKVSSFKETGSLICYPSGFYLIISVIVPICIILAINVTMFILVIYAISKGPDGKMRKSDIDLIGAQLRLSIFLFFLLGLTWIFGVLSFSSNPLWSYFFCLTSTMQGFVLFVYFIICDVQTRTLWITLMKPQFQSESARKSITSISSN